MFYLHSYTNVLYLPTCMHQRAMPPHQRALVPICQILMHASVLYVPRFQRALRANMPKCQHSSTLCLPTCQCANVIFYAKHGKCNTTELRYMLQHYRKRITTAILLIFSKYIWTNKNFYLRNLLTTKYTQSLSCKAFFTFLM